MYSYMNIIHIYIEDYCKDDIGWNDIWFDPYVEYPTLDG